MTMLALLGGYRLKGGNTLFNFSAFALWTLEPLLFVLRDFHRQGKLPMAFFAEKLIGRHDNPPATCKPVTVVLDAAILFLASGNL
jgi:hypothetical protein